MMRNLIFQMIVLSLTNIFQTKATFHNESGRKQRILNNPIHRNGYTILNPKRNKFSANESRQISPPAASLDAAFRTETT